MSDRANIPNEGDDRLRVVGLGLRYIDGEISAEEMAQLHELLSQERDHRRLFVQLCLQSRLMRETLEPTRAAVHESPEPSAVELLRDILEQQREAAERRAMQAAERALREAEIRAERRDQFQYLLGSRDPVAPVRHIVIPRSLVYGAAAAMAAMVVLTVTLLWRGASSVPPQPPGPPTPQVAQDPVLPPMPVEVGQVVTLFDAQWSDGSQVLAVRQPVRNKPIHLTAGFALLRMASGAEVLLEAPAVLTPIDGTHVQLSRGKLVGWCQTMASRGFVVETPGARIVDVGTEFGVEVTGTGQTLTKVFEGAVELTALQRSDQTIAMRAGEAKSVDSAGWTVRDTELTDLHYVRRNEFTALQRAQSSAYHRWLAYSYTLRRQPDVVAYYTFEDAAGQGVLRNLAKATDGKLHGTLSDAMRSAGIAQMASGRFPQKAALNFFAANGNFIAVPVHDAAMLEGDITIAVWVKPDWDSSPEDMTILSQREGFDGAMGIQLSLLGDIAGRDWSPRAVQFMTQQNATAMRPGGWFTRSVLSLEPRWLHLVVTANDEVVKVYLDGRLVDELEGCVVTPAEAPLLIGAANHGTDEHTILDQYGFHGVIDELLIVNRAMTEAEVRSLYEQTRQDP